MELINKEELLERLEENFGDLEDDSGCYAYVNGERVWFSMARIINVIEQCEVYEED